MKINFLRVLKASLGLFVAMMILVMLPACSGGVSEPNIAPTPIANQRTDLLYGYFGSTPTQLGETVDHVNIYFAAVWDGPAAQLQQMIDAKNAGVPVIVDFGGQEIRAPFSVAESEPRVRARLAIFRDAGVLQSIYAIYPHDEPELHGMTHDDVLAMTSMVRRVAAEFGINPKLATFYTPSWKWPGVGSFDLVGFDNYDAGAKIFTNGDYDKLKAALRPDQQIMLIPGGADKWRADPDQFFNMAQQDPQVKILMPFLWRDLADPANGAMAGIRSNGLADKYRSVGMQISHPARK